MRLLSCLSGVADINKVILSHFPICRLQKHNLMRLDSSFCFNRCQSLGVATDAENSFDLYTSFIRNVITISTHFVILDLQDSIRRVFVFAPTAVRSVGRKKS